MRCCRFPMSALGQKRTCAAHKLMSALPPIATAKATSARGHVCFTPESGHVRCNSPCLLWAKSGHEQSQQSNRLFDHLVGLCEQRLRNGEPDRPGSLEVEHQLVLCW